VTVMQFLLYLYHNHAADFAPLCMSSEFLSALAATLFPYKLMSESNSEIVSPLDDFQVCRCGCVCVCVCVCDVFQMKSFAIMLLVETSVRT